MGSYQKQYISLLKKLIDNPKKIGDSRVGKVNSNFVDGIRINLKKEFPLMELKKVKFSNVLHELLWMIRGETNVKYLIENECGIWTDDAYRYFKEKHAIKNENNQLSLDMHIDKDTFIEYTLKGKKIDKYVYGDLDKIYGHQWRRFCDQTDQLKNAIEKLKSDPDNRRIIVTAHNPTDIENNVVGLPSCHNYFQFYTILNDKTGRRELSCFVNIRSNDYFLGNPYNTAQYAMLTHIVANIVDMDVDELYINMVDCHLYHEHFDAASKIIERYNNLPNNMCHEDGIYVKDTYCKSNFIIKRKLISIDDVTFDDFEIENYVPQTYIKAPLLT